MFRYSAAPRTTSSGRKYHTKPTPEYLRACTQTDIPNISAKKLLILDLNGTLLFREPRRPPMSKHSSSRNIYTRPFMPTFRQYLFHAETRSWLDTMIWSSAQPHNVALMVNACFGADKDNLTQIWARDRMGLDEHSYNQKVQTIKDLDQIWQSPHYSVYNTILFDDSMKKAVLQPYNHILVKEYHDQLPRKNASSDTSLLALIGILENLKSQTNVAKWIKDGRIIPRDVQTSSATNKWFESDPILQHWTLKGRIALDRLGISIQADVRSS